MLVKVKSLPPKEVFYLSTLQPTACLNCRKIVTDKVDETSNKPLTVWVCEHCGSENETPSPDAQAVQEELNAAVSQVTPPPPPAAVAAPVAPIEPAAPTPIAQTPTI